MKQSPTMQRGSELRDTASKVTPAAMIVMKLAVNIVLRRPAASNNAPVNILPRPLQIERTPTNVVASESAAPTPRTRSFAKLITELPTAVRQIRQTNARQKVKRFIISEVVKSFASNDSLFAFFFTFISGNLTLS